jgi:hypothetical protein
MFAEAEFGGNLRSLLDFHVGMATDGSDVLERDPRAWGA